MNRILAIGLGALLLAVSGASNAIPLSVSAGDDGSFHWDKGLGSDMTWTLDDGLGGPHPYDSLEITVATDSLVSIFAVDDCCVVGDAFALLLDGAVTAWTSEGFTGPGGLFQAEAVDLFLTSGTHTIDLLVTADCCIAGAGSWAIGDIAKVPEPSVLALLGLGIFGIGVARRKQ